MFLKMSTCLYALYVHLTHFIYFVVLCSQKCSWIKGSPPFFLVCRHGRGPFRVTSAILYNANIQKMLNLSSLAYIHFCSFYILCQLNGSLTKKRNILSSFLTLVSFQTCRTISFAEHKKGFEECFNCPYNTFLTEQKKKNISQNTFFCVPQKKFSLTGLE